MKSELEPVRLSSGPKPMRFFFGPGGGVMRLRIATSSDWMLRSCVAIRRFPPDFAFELTDEEWAALRSQFATSNARPGRGGRRYRPYAFTEHGAVMAASVLNSDRAVEVSVFVVRAFVRMSRMLASHRQLALKLAELEARVTTHDRSIQSLLAAIRSLITPPEPKKKRIGFVTDDDKPGHTGSASDFIARDRRRRKR